MIRYFTILFWISPILAFPNPAIECHLYINDMTINSPLFLDPSGKELMPEGKNFSIVLKETELVVIGCYSSGNKVSGYSTRTVNGVCLGQNRIKTRKGVYDFNSFSCLRPMFPVVSARGSCLGPKRGKLFEIGFKGEGADFMKTVTLCHIRERGETVWVYYTLHPQVYKYRARHIPMDEDFKIGQIVDIYGSIVSNISKVYATAKEQVVQPIVGPIPIKENVTVGMLAAYEDFVTLNSQRSTFFYLNSVPMWSSVNYGPWRAIEATIRKRYREDTDALTVVVGTYGIKAINDKDLWLSPGMVPFPRYMWKILFRDGKSIVFSVENTSMSKKGVTNTPFADNMSCLRRGWNFGKYNERITCGSFKKLLSIIGANNLPNSIVQQLTKKAL